MIVEISDDHRLTSMDQRENLKQSPPRYVTLELQPDIDTAIGLMKLSNAKHDWLLQVMKEKVRFSD